MVHKAKRFFSSLKKDYYQHSITFIWLFGSPFLIPQAWGHIDLQYNKTCNPQVLLRLWVATGWHARCSFWNKDCVSHFLPFTQLSSPYTMTCAFFSCCSQSETDLGQLRGMELYINVYIVVLALWDNLHGPCFVPQGAFPHSRRQILSQEYPHLLLSTFILIQTNFYCEHKKQKRAIPNIPSERYSGGKNKILVSYLQIVLIMSLDIVLRHISQAVP